MCKFVRAKLLKWLEISNLFSWLTLEMMNLDDYHANSHNFHELAKLIFCGISFNALFITLVFRAVCFKEQLCLSLMMQNFKIESAIKLLIHHINEKKKMINYRLTQNASIKV